MKPVLQVKFECEPEGYQIFSEHVPDSVVTLLEYYGEKVDFLGEFEVDCFEDVDNIRYEANKACRGKAEARLYDREGNLLLENE